MSEQVEDMGGQYLAEGAESVVPEGYKLTEVGVIPEDWIISTLGPHAFFTTGPFGSALHKSDYVGGGIPVVNPMQIVNGKIFPTYSMAISESAAKKLKDFRLCKGDIVIGRRGDMGRCAVVTSIEDGWLCGTGSMIVRTKITADPNFLQLILASDPVVVAIENASVGTTMINLNQSTLRELNIALPANKQEQIAIATALSDVDALISEQEKLIAKKQAIKTATMQQLLTGRTRLPQFALREDGSVKGYKQSELGEVPEDWEVATIRELTKNIIDYRGRTPKKLGLDWGGGNIVALSAGNVKAGYIDFEAECYLGSEELYLKWMRNGEAKKGDIVFTMEAPLGNVAMIPDNERYILSQRTILLQCNECKYYSEFIFQALYSEEFRKVLEDSATGSTAQGIKRTRLEALAVSIPPSIQEQREISVVLSNMDSEIRELEKILSKTRKIKQGMMQELLTGKTRLLKPEQLQ